MEDQGIQAVVLNNNNSNNSVRMEHRGRGQEGTYQVRRMISIDLDLSSFLDLPTLYCGFCQRKHDPMP